MFGVMQPSARVFLVQNNPADADRWIHIVPLRGNVLVGNLKISLLSGQHRWRTGKKQALLIAQNDLIEGIVKFESDFDLLDFTIAAILDRSENIGDFLIQKIG